MDIFTGLSELLGSSAVGGIIGGVFGWMNKREAREVLKLQIADRQAERDHRLNEVRVESEADIALAETEGRIAFDIQDSKTLAESVKGAFERTGIFIVDATRGLMRPIITAYLMFSVTMIAYKLDKLVGGLEALPANELFDLYRVILLQVVALCGIAVGWWFASRPARINH